MSNENFEQYFKLNKNLLSPWTEFGKTVMETSRRASQGSLEIVSENLSRHAEQLKRISHAKHPEEVLSIQKECFSENLSAWISDCQKLVNLSLGGVEDINKSFSTTVRDQAQAGPNAHSSKAGERERSR